ncbi:MAG: hypothetical protein IPP29_25085 [Bacteroidetes bacterium]|nr:hypothetical protein [Bacteroidota bacterium]
MVSLLSSIVWATTDAKAYGLTSTPVLENRYEFHFNVYPQNLSLYAPRFRNSIGNR